MDRWAAIEKAVLSVTDTSGFSKDNSMPNAIKRGADVPVAKRQNAIKKYAHGVDADDIIVIMDCSVFNSYKSGMLITENGFYSTEYYSGAFGNGKIPLPVVLDDLKSISAVDDGSWTLLSYKDGSTQKAYCGIYTAYVVKVLQAVILALRNDRASATAAAVSVVAAAIDSSTPTEDKADRFFSKFADMDDFSDKDGFEFTHEPEPEPVVEPETAPETKPKDDSLEAQIQALLNSKL